jgi:hypothetical protein
MGINVLNSRLSHLAIYHYRIRTLKATVILGKYSVKKSVGKTVFAECFLSGVALSKV